MNYDDIIRDLKNQLQQLEDAKMQITEAQEDIRATIAAIQMEEVQR